MLNLPLQFFCTVFKHKKWHLRKLRVNFILYFLSAQFGKLSLVRHERESKGYNIESHTWQKFEVSALRYTADMLDMMKESISLIGLEKIIIKNFFKIFGIFGHFFYQSFGILFRKQIIEVLSCYVALPQMSIAYLLLLHRCPGKYSCNLFG